MARKPLSGDTETTGDSAPVSERESADTDAATMTTTEAPAATGATTGDTQGDGGAGAPPSPTQTRPAKARVPYPHSSLTLPGGGTTPDGGGERGDLVVTREFTPVPADQVQRLKDTARRARIRLVLLVPDDNETGA